MRTSFQKVLPKEVTEAYLQLEKEIGGIPIAKKSHGLESRVLAILGLGGLIVSAMSFSLNVTGYTIATTTFGKINSLGIILFVLGLIFLILSAKRRKINYKQKTATTH